MYYINPGGGYDLEKMSDGRMAAVLTNDVSISVVVLSVTQYHKIGKNKALRKYI